MPSTWKPPYDDVRRNLGIRQKTVAPELQEQADSRIRTYKKLFEGRGLMYEDGGVLRVTPLGQRLQHSSATCSGRLMRRPRRCLPRLGGGSRGSVQCSFRGISCATPRRTTSIPRRRTSSRCGRSSVRCARWTTRSTGKRSGGLLTKRLRMSELPSAIETIAKARAEADYDPADPASAEKYLGPRKPDLGEDHQDRIIVWMSRAGFKDLLIEHRNRSDGYRYLNDEFVSLVDELLASSPTQRTFASNAEYVQWLGSEPETAAGSNDVVTKIVDRCRTHGDRFLIALIGPAGTGKTRYAEKAARQLVDGDASRWESIQFHAAFTYEEFVGGLAPTADGGFERQPGVLLEINERALESELVHVLVIDELSRADIANVLGELLTYVEYRGRAFRVAALGREVVLAPNLVVIATLNPTDRSVVNLDDAVVRRLRQIHLPRDPDALRDILNEAGMATEVTQPGRGLVRGAARRRSVRARVVRRRCDRTGSA